jgi:hypothetical protein
LQQQLAAARPNFRWDDSKRHRLVELVNKFYHDNPQALNLSTQMYDALEKEFPGCTRGGLKGQVQTQRRLDMWRN